MRRFPFLLIALLFAAAAPPLTSLADEIEVEAHLGADLLRVVNESDDDGEEKVRVTVFDIFDIVTLFDFEVEEDEYEYTLIDVPFAHVLSVESEEDESEFEFVEVDVGLAEATIFEMETEADEGTSFELVDLEVLGLDFTALYGGPSGYGVIDTDIVSLYTVGKDEGETDRRFLSIPLIGRSLYRHVYGDDGHGFQLLYFININMPEDD